MLEDSPECRAALETAAIPKCKVWRERFQENGKPAPYCCSSYCARCAGLRALDGVEALLPNEWMTQALRGAPGMHNG